ncbi:hypothetical protein QWZ04_01855 [Vibrio tapetis subsp. quintayensis]|uniref:hypothetical protein n=1 Tax=Vibrio tapetis TaxID=52443 RepID=UPI0025B50B74|nr:hypothetical protein [Vibrio tapetis]MDN3679070.1 hypothetical protein [Vibrio tapetis subsp. quintayensis]
MAHSRKKQVIIDTDMGWGGLLAKSLLELGSQTQAKITLGTETPTIELHGNL